MRFLHVIRIGSSRREQLFKTDFHGNNSYGSSSYLPVNTLLSITKAKRLILFEKVRSFHSVNYGKRLNTLRGQNNGS